MKFTVKKPCEIEVSAVRVSLHVRYEEEDIPNDFPLRTGDMWNATIYIDSGRIKEWPRPQSGTLHMKVCDEGTYTLLGPDGKEIATIEQNYVPHGVIPGKYGDYVDLKINSFGTITNWPQNPDVSAFFEAK